MEKITLWCSVVEDTLYWFLSEEEAEIYSDIAAKEEELSGRSEGKSVYYGINSIETFIGSKTYLEVTTIKKETEE